MEPITGIGKLLASSASRARLVHARVPVGAAKNASGSAGTSARHRRHTLVPCRLAPGSPPLAVRGAPACPCVRMCAWQAVSVQLDAPSGNLSVSARWEGGAHGLAMDVRSLPRVVLRLALGAPMRLRSVLGSQTRERKKGSPLWCFA